MMNDNNFIALKTEFILKTEQDQNGCVGKYSHFDDICLLTSLQFLQMVKLYTILINWTTLDGIILYIVV